jgi:hypothetical protein
MLTPRSGLEIGAINNTFYAIGGFSGATVFGNNEEYMPLEDTLAPFPSPSPSPSFSSSPSPIPSLSPSLTTNPSST